MSSNTSLRRNTSNASFTSSDSPSPNSSPPISTGSSPVHSHVSVPTSVGSTASSPVPPVTTTASAPPPITHVSALTAEFGEEDQSRYQKLIQEYQKIRAQNAILKKAVVQEQQKTAELEKSLQDKDKELRSALEENDQLQFNNQRLAKRLATLQDQFEELSKKKESSWFRGSSSATKAEVLRLQQELEVTREQLAAKLQENADLHNKMAEVQSANESTLSLLEQKLDALKKKLQKTQQELDIATQERNTTVQELESEKERLSNRATALELSLQQAVDAAAEKSNLLSQMQAKFTQDLARLQTTIRRKVLFDDTAMDEYNRYNLAPFDPRRHARAVAAIASLLPAIRDYATSADAAAAALHEKLTLLNGRANLAEALRAVDRKISPLLPLFRRHVDAVVDAVATLVVALPRAAAGHTGVDADTDAARRGLATALEELFSYHKKLVSYLLERIQIEDAPGNGRIATKQLTGAYQMLLAALDGVATKCPAVLAPVATAAVGTNTATGDALSTASAPLFELAGAIGELARRLGELEGALTARHEEEQHEPGMPVALATPNRALSDAVGKQAAAVLGLQSPLEALASLLSAPTAGPTHGVEASPSNALLGTAEASAERLKRRARGYMDRLARVPRPAPPITYLDALRDRTGLVDATAELAARERLVAEATNAARAAEAEAERLRAELSTARDTLASRGAQLTALLEELANTRAALAEADRSNRRLRDELAEAVDARDRLDRMLKEDTARAAAVVEPQGVSMLSTPTTAFGATLLQTGGLMAPLMPAVASPQVSTPAGDLLTDFDVLPMATGGTVPPPAVTASVPASSGSLIDLDFELPPPTTVGANLPLAGSGLIDSGGSIIDSSPSPVTPQKQAAAAVPGATIQVPVMSPPSTGSGSDAPTPPPAPTDVAKNYSIVVLDEAGNQYNTLKLLPSDREREAAVKRFYEDRMGQLMGQIAKADQRAVELHRQLEATAAALDVAQRERAALDTALQQARSELVGVKEELELTRKSYDEQIKVLTEHMLELNAKIVQQDLEMTELKKRAAAASAPVATQRRK